MGRGGVFPQHGEDVRGCDLSAKGAKGKARRAKGYVQRGANEPAQRARTVRPHFRFEDLEIWRLAPGRRRRGSVENSHMTLSDRPSPRLATAAFDGDLHLRHRQIQLHFFDRPRLAQPQHPFEKLALVHPSSLSAAATSAIPRPIFPFPANPSLRLIFLFIRGRVLQTLVAPISEEKCDLGGVA